MEVWDKGDETFVNIFWDPTLHNASGWGVGGKGGGYLELTGDKVRSCCPTKGLMGRLGQIALVWKHHLGFPLYKTERGREQTNKLTKKQTNLQTNYKQINKLAKYLKNIIRDSRCTKWCGGKNKQTNKQKTDKQTKKITKN